MSDFLRACAIRLAGAVMRAGRIADDKLPGGHLVAPLAIDLGWWIGDVATRGVPDGPHGIDEP